MMSLIADWVPWWVWLALGGGILIATYSIWLPWWLLIPEKARLGIIGAVAAILAYLAGRNKGASGALQRAQEQEQARADDIIQDATRARQRADADALAGGLRSDDGHKRQD